MHREPHRFADMEISREERDITGKLEEQFLHLKRDWDSYKKSSNPLSSPLLISGSCSSSIIEGLQLLDDSPRAIMASLQCRASPPPPPSHLPWKFTRHRYDISAEEAVRDRRAAIEGGQLKGCRRLFYVEIDEMGYSLSDVIGSGSEAERGSTAASSYNCDSSDIDEAGHQLGGTVADKYNYIVPLDCCSSSAATSSSLSVHDKSVVSAMVEEQRIEHLTTVAEKAASDRSGKKQRKVTGPGLGLGIGLKREFLVLAWLIIIIACAMGRYWRRGGKGQVISLPTPT